MKRLFEFDKIDIVIAASQQAAIDFYQQEFGHNNAEMDEMHIVAIPEDEWESRDILADEEEGGEEIKVTLKEWVEQFDENTPQIIASTEY